MSAKSLAGTTSAVWDTIEHFKKMARQAAAKTLLDRKLTGRHRPAFGNAVDRGPAQAGDTGHSPCFITSRDILAFDIDNLAAK